MTVYKTKTSYILGNSILFLFPLALTIVTFTEGEAATQNEWIGLAGFWIICILVVFSAVGAKIEVGKDYVTNYFLGFRTRTLQASDVEVVEYGNLFRGGLGVGKGLKVWERTPNGKKYYSLGEKAFGKDAITHAKRVLSSKL